MPGLQEMLKGLGFAGNPIGAVAAGVQTVAQLGAGIGELIGAGKDKKEAEQLIKDNPRPKFSIPKTINDNQSLAESEAATGGFSDDAMIAYTNKSERDFSNSLRNIMMSGGGANDMGALYDKQSDSSSDLAILTEELRKKKISDLIVQNDKKADWDTTQWQVNEYGPYADAMAKSAKLMDAARQRKAQGIGMLSGAAGNLATSSLYNEDGTFKKKT